MSETSSFVDPVFLARFGLSRVNAVDYFLHPLNPFKTPVHTSNEVLAMQGTAIGLFMQQGLDGEPISPQAAENEYNRALTQINGEQYELLPPVDPMHYTQPSPLYTIRHVLRTSPNSVKVLGIYYIVEGVIYMAPSVRSLMKANVTRTLGGLAGACNSLSVCAKYQPSTGYTWVFEDEEDQMDPVALIQLAKKRKRRKILDNRRPGERTAAEEEGIRASEALDQILVRLSKSKLVVPSYRTVPTSQLNSSKSSATSTTSSTSVPPASVSTKDMTEVPAST